MFSTSSMSKWTIVEAARYSITNVDLAAWDTSIFFGHEHHVLELSSFLQSKDDLLGPLAEMFALPAPNLERPGSLVEFDAVSWQFVYSTILRLRGHCHHLIR